MKDLLKIGSYWEYSKRIRYLNTKQGAFENAILFIDGTTHSIDDAPDMRYTGRFGEMCDRIDADHYAVKRLKRDARRLRAVYNAMRTLESEALRKLLWEIYCAYLTGEKPFPREKVVKKLCISEGLYRWQLHELKRKLQNFIQFNAIFNSMKTHG